MKIFITGVTGFIGGSIAKALVESGHQVAGLVRDDEKVEFLKKQGIEPIKGSLSDLATLSQAAQNSDIIVNAADADNREVVEVILSAIRGSNKTFIHTSGSSIVADASGGEFSEKVFDETMELKPHEEKVSRVAIDSLVRDSAKQGIRSIVICPTMIYGTGSGYKSHSIQIPMLIKQAKKDGVARYIGRGLNVWSNVHIDDLVNLYLLALEKAQAGDFFFAENGKQELKAISEEIGQILNLPVESWTENEAVEAFGRGAAVFSLGSNSRVRALKARRDLGWQPKTNDILGAIKSDLKV